MWMDAGEILLQRCQHKAEKANLAKVATVEMGGDYCSKVSISCRVRHCIFTHNWGEYFCISSKELKGDIVGGTIAAISMCLCTKYR